MTDVQQKDDIGQTLGRDNREALNEGQQSMHSFHSQHSAEISLLKT